MYIPYGLQVILTVKITKNDRAPFSERKHDSFSG